MAPPSAAASGRPTFCPECGTTLEADTDFCYACGAEVRRDEDAGRVTAGGYGVGSGTVAEEPGAGRPDAPAPPKGATAPDVGTGDTGAADPPGRGAVLLAYALGAVGVIVPLVGVVGILVAWWARRAGNPGARKALIVVAVLTLAGVVLNASFLAWCLTTPGADPALCGPVLEGLP